MWDKKVALVLQLRSLLKVAQTEISQRFWPKASSMINNMIMLGLAKKQHKKKKKQETCIIVGNRASMAHASKAIHGLSEHW